MTIFKTYWKIVKQNIGIIILYTVMLLVFGTMNLKANKNSFEFISSNAALFAPMSAKNSSIFALSLIYRMYLAPRSPLLISNPLSEMMHPAASRISFEGNDSSR